MNAISIKSVLFIHDRILARYGGLAGFSKSGEDGLQSALQRIENHMLYNQVNNVFEIAALYGVALARGHIFNDGNKRTALACTLLYLDQCGIFIPKNPDLEQAIVDIATGAKDYLWFAQYLSSLAQLSKIN